MDIMEILDVVAESVTTFFGAISLGDTLLIAGIFALTVFFMLMAHIVFGTKASTKRRMNAIARYFERHYIGTYLDARRFLRRKGYLLTKKARREFDMFLHSTTRLTDTEFTDAVSLRGKDSLVFVLDTYSIAMVVALAFTLLKSVISGLNGLQMAIFNVTFLVGMFVLRLLLLCAMRQVNKGYKRAVKRLVKAEGYVRLNNEGYVTAGYTSAPSFGGIVNTPTVTDSAETLLDGDTMVNVMDNADSIRASLSPEDIAVFDEFVARMDTASETN